MHPRLVPIAADLDRQRAALLAAAGRPAAVLETDLSDGSWSPAAVLEHLAVVEGGVVRLLAKRLLRAKEQGLGPDPATEPLASTLAHAYLTQKIDAPENVRPAPGVSAADALAHLDASHAALHALLADADGYDLTRVLATHQIFGELNMYEWLVFLARHEERHVAQLQRALRAIDAF